MSPRGSPPIPGPPSVPAAAGREARLRAVLLEVARRLSAGLSVDRHRLVAEHPDLMPELLDELALQDMAHQQFLAARRAGPVADDVRPEPGQPADSDAETLHVDPPGEDDEVAVVGYRVLGEVKRGGQATVYRAVNESTGRAVALKVLAGGPLLTRRRQARLDREADVLASLRHPNIVAVIDRGRTNDGSVYLAMDFVEGPELDQWVRQLGRGADGSADPGAGDDGPPVDAVVELMARVCEAAGEAHAHGIVHRDLKPSNVLVDRRGQPHLLDFGLARVLLDEEEEGVSPAEAARRAVTRTGQVVGSLPWLSPEQAAGTTGGVDARSDVYALGVMLYEALVQRPPYATDGMLADALTNILYAVPPPPGRVRGGVPAAVDAVVMKALAKRAEDRYADAGEMARDLRAWLAGRAVEAPAYRRPGRRRALLIGAAALAAVAAAGGVWFAVHRGGTNVAASGGGGGVPPATSASGPVRPSGNPPAAGGPDSRPTAGRRVIALFPAHDAFVQAGPFSRKALGRETADNELLFRQLQVRVDKAMTPGLTRDAYLKFDLNAIPAGATVRSARLYLHGAAGPERKDPLYDPMVPRPPDALASPAAAVAARPPAKAGLTVSAHALQNRRADWDEATIVYATRPFILGYDAVEKAKGHVTIPPGPPAWRAIDLTDFVRSERARNAADPGDAVRWLSVALHVVGGSDLWAQFSSSEGTYPPRIEVEVEGE